MTKYCYITSEKLTLVQELLWEYKENASSPTYDWEEFARRRNMRLDDDVIDVLLILTKHERGSFIDWINKKREPSDSDSEDAKLGASSTSGSVAGGLVSAPSPHAPVNETEGSEVDKAVSDVFYEIGTASPLLSVPSNHGCSSAAASERTYVESQKSTTACEASHINNEDHDPGSEFQLFDKLSDQGVWDPSVVAQLVGNNGPSLIDDEEGEFWYDLSEEMESKSTRITTIGCQSLALGDSVPHSHNEGGAPPVFDQRSEEVGVRWEIPAERAQFVANNEDGDAPWDPGGTFADKMFDGALTRAQPDRSFFAIVVTPNDGTDPPSPLLLVPSTHVGTQKSATIPEHDNLFVIEHKRVLISAIDFDIGNYTRIEDSGLGIFRAKPSNCLDGLTPDGIVALEPRDRNGHCSSRLVRNFDVQFFILSSVYGRHICTPWVESVTCYKGGGNLSNSSFHNDHVQLFGDTSHDRELLKLHFLGFKNSVPSWVDVVTVFKGGTGCTHDYILAGILAPQQQYVPRSWITTACDFERGNHLKEFLSLEMDSRKLSLGSYNLDSFNSLSWSGGNELLQGVMAVDCASSTRQEENWVWTVLGHSSSFNSQRDVFSIVEPSDKGVEQSTDFGYFQRRNSRITNDWAKGNFDAYSQGICILGWTEGPDVTFDATPYTKGHQFLSFGVFGFGVVIPKYCGEHCDLYVIDEAYEFRVVVLILHRRGCARTIPLLVGQNYCYPWMLETGNGSYSRSTPCGFYGLSNQDFQEVMHKHHSNFDEG